MTKLPGGLHADGTAGLGPLPLVGREVEIARIRARLTSGERRAFVVAGPPGVGKTRLASEVASSLASEGHPHAHVAATAGAASIPFGVFAPLLGDVDLSPAEGHFNSCSGRRKPSSKSTPATARSCWWSMTGTSSTMVRPLWSTNSPTEAAAGWS